MAELLTGLNRLSGAGTQSGLTRIQRQGRDLTFSDVLKARLEKESGISFSAHTVERLRERGISLDDVQLNRLSEAVQKAEAKGGDDTLVMLDDKAFIVSVPNRTVITAMTGDSMKENVFTNIDSAVIA